jgi:anti-sigma factor RsiW
MTHESALRIQAYLDDELTASEREQLSAWIREDAEAKALYEALAATTELVAENEPEYKLNESREFYWSKIERQIQAQAPLAPPRPRLSLGWRLWWPRLAVSCAAAGLLAALIISSSRPGSPANYYVQEVEAPENMMTITFHSESANMTVVWVQSPEDTN